MNKMIWSAILPLVLLGPAFGAEEEPKEPKEALSKPLVPLRLQVVFSRYQGEKKVSSLPYTLSVNAEGRPAKLRMGIMVPIQTMANNTPTVQYKDASNNLDCSVETLDAGRFKVSCSLEQGSIYEAEPGRAMISPSGPMLRTFRSETDLLLRDGQTAQYTAATDPVSGETLKIDMTLTVVK